MESSELMMFNNFISYLKPSVFEKCILQHFRPNSTPNQFDYKFTVSVKNEIKQMSPTVRHDLFYDILEESPVCIYEVCRDTRVDKNGNILYERDYLHTSDDFFIKHVLNIFSAGYIYKQKYFDGGDHPNGVILNDFKNTDPDEQQYDDMFVEQTMDCHPSMFIIRWKYKYSISLLMLFKSILKLKQMSERARHIANMPDTCAFKMAAQRFKNAQYKHQRLF